MPGRRSSTRNAGGKPDRSGKPKQGHTPPNYPAKIGLDPDARDILKQRLEQLPAWQSKRKALENAEFEEKRVRSLLEAHPEIVERIEQERITDLQNDLAIAAQQADEYEKLIGERAATEKLLDQAGADHELSRARSVADSARAALQDKREEALLHEATELLLDDVEQAFQAENEPEVLSRARTLFREITAHAFDLELDKDGAFLARDLRQQALRQLGELSSGTRMQLLLALRLAWTEAQEQGGETLPLFLDEALTTSEPPAIDLAAVRFPGEALSPQDYNVALPASLPSPESRDPETYASVLGVPGLNPRLEPGIAHLFYILRDDLDLMYQFMETWRITSLGQLETLLDSNAGPAAVTDTGLRDRLRLRCDTVRAWTALWRQGRGRPVNRITLEQSGTVTETFIDRVADLSEEVEGDGEALVQALRAGQVSGFRTSKIEELERWLADEGYTDQEEILIPEERRRQTLQQAMSNAGADIEDANQVITWLESIKFKGSE